MSDDTARARARIQNIRQMRNDWDAGKYDYLIEPLIPKLIALLENKHHGNEDNENEDRQDNGLQTHGGGDTGGTKTGTGTMENETGEKQQKRQEEKEGREGQEADTVGGGQSQSKDTDDGERV